MATLAVIDTPGRFKNYWPNPEFSKSYAYSSNVTLGGKRIADYGNVLTMHGQDSGLGDFLYGLSGLGDTTANTAPPAPQAPIPPKPIIKKPGNAMNIPDWFWIAGAVVGYLIMLPKGR